MNKESGRRIVISFAGTTMGVMTAIAAAWSAARVVENIVDYLGPELRLQSQRPAALAFGCFLGTDQLAKWRT